MCDKNTDKYVIIKAIKESDFVLKQMAQIRNQVLLNKIALRLKELREQKGVSQQELYNQTEIHIARIETAKINVSISTLERLCLFFGLSLSEFFAGIDRKKK